MILNQKLVLLEWKVKIKHSYQKNKKNNKIVSVRGLLKEKKNS